MMERLRRMFTGSSMRTPNPLGPSDRAELAQARTDSKRALTRADRAIRLAMEHADSVFHAPSTYRGPERRRVRR